LIPVLIVLGDQPTVADPYEKKMIFIADGVMQVIV
jgi:hypothetical protein